MNYYDIKGNALSNVYDIHGNIITQKNTFKIMSYNVGQWYTGKGSSVPEEQKDEYIELQNGILSRHTPDILCIQEYSSNFCADGTTAENLLSQYFTQIEPKMYSNVMASRAMCSNGIKLSNITSHAFDDTGSGYYPSFEIAEMNIGGHTVYLINTHNSYNIAAQTSEITQILNAIKDYEYFILCGDFNIDLSTEDVESEQYKNSVKQFIDAGYNTANFSDFGWFKCYYDSSEATGGKYTDNIVTSANITIDNAYIDEAKLADDIADKIDHLPIIAEITIN